MLIGALVIWQEGAFVVEQVNDDDSVTLRSELTLRMYRATKDEIVMLPLAEQPEAYLVQCLVAAWEARLWELARQQVQSAKAVLEVHGVATMSEHLQWLLEAPCITITQVPPNQEATSAALLDLTVKEECDA